MRTSAPAFLGLLTATTLGLAGCDGSSSPHPSSSSPAPVAIGTCPASVAVPPDTTLAVPSASLPPTAVIPAGGALSVDVPTGSTVGLAVPVEQGAGAVLCRAVGPAVGRIVLVARQPGFVRLAVAGVAGMQRVVNVRVTV